jgi:hypothetical protein
MEPGYCEEGYGDAGIIVQARDSENYHWVHIPWGGQQTRAKHFWAAISRVDASGYVRNLKLSMVPGIPAEPTAATTRWYKIAVECFGSEIRTWIDGVPGPTVRTEKIRAGAIGLARSSQRLPLRSRT